MSQKIRIGNDIDITWSLKDADEQPYIVEGKNVEIELNVGTKRVKIKEFELSGNQIHFVYYGKDQKHTGSYALKYIENPDDPNMVTFDTKDAFYMVDHSWLAVDEGETPETIQVEVVTLSSELNSNIGPKGDTGDPAGFGEVDAEADNNVGTPSVEVQTSGPDTAKNFHFTFRNIKGETGAQGIQGPQGIQGIQGIQGEKGDKGDSAFFAVAGTTLTVSAYNAEVEGTTLKIS